MVIQKMKALEIKLLVLLLGFTLSSQVKNTCVSVALNCIRRGRNATYKTGLIYLVLISVKHNMSKRTRRFSITCLFSRFSLFSNMHIASDVILSCIKTCRNISCRNILKTKNQKVFKLYKST